MTDYFEELNCQPIAAEDTASHQLLLMVRYLQQSGYDELLNMGNGEDKLPPPASKELVKNLKWKLVKPEDEKCAICLLPNKNLNGQKFLILPCSHEFHDTCIKPWLEKTNSCPLCRSEMKTDDEDYEQQKNHKQREAQRAEDIDMLHNSMYG
ncbi:unnamed protein product [Diamesa serratosioi]